MYSLSDLSVSQHSLHQGTTVSTLSYKVSLALSLSLSLACCSNYYYTQAAIRTSKHVTLCEPVEIESRQLE